MGVTATSASYLGMDLCVWGLWGAWFVCGGAWWRCLGGGSYTHLGRIGGRINFLGGILCRDTIYVFEGKWVVRDG